MILQASICFYFLLEFALAVSDGEYISFPCSPYSKEVQACIHRYAEKDFSAISPYIYGKTSRESSSSERCFSRTDSQKPAPGGGQEFEDNCNHLYDVIHCLESELVLCQTISSFFMLRNLVYALNKMVFLICGTQHNSEGYVSETEAMSNKDNQHRLQMLLDSLDCLECVRTSNINECVAPPVVNDPHLWMQIIRLEKTPAEVCPHLKKQIKCFKSKKIVSTDCGDKAHEIYANLTKVFVNAWCNKNSLLSSTTNFALNELLTLSTVTYWTFTIFS